MDRRFGEVTKLYSRFSCAAILHRDNGLQDILKVWETSTDRLLFCIKNNGKQIRLSDGEIINANALYDRIYDHTDTYLKSLGV